MIQEIFDLLYFNCKNSTRYAYDLQGRAVTIDAFIERKS